MSIPKNLIEGVFGSIVADIYDSTQAAEKQKPSKPSAPKLTRKAFEQSRLLEFFTQKELSLQIGTGPSGWAVALIKELIDNGLDACEGAGIDPVITVTAANGAITVADNGPGIRPDIVTRQLDYSIRVSTNSLYVSPTRGQLGNALKCVWAAPFVLNGTHGRVEVEANGKKHLIDVRLDHIRQEPVISHVLDESTVKIGTKFTLHWPDSASRISESGEPDFYRAASTLVHHFASLNPHASFSFNGETHQRTGAIEKWNPSDPTSPHWYTTERLRDLIAAHLARGDDMSLRDFVEDFRGLKSTQKRKDVMELSMLGGKTIQQIVIDGKVNITDVENLLYAMRKYSAPVKAQKLGFVGSDHVLNWMSPDIHVSSFQYKRLTAEVDGIPYVVEAAMGVFVDPARHRTIMAGANFTPLPHNPFAEVQKSLSLNRCDAFDQCLVWIHVITPRLDFTDRGKTRAEIPPEVPIGKAIEAVGKYWKGIKKDADREGRARERRIDEELKRERSTRMTFKDAAYQVMEAAYLKASNNGTLPANARQVMYAARGDILRLTGKEKMDDAYFTQTLLPNFQDENPELTAGWDVAYDDRGNLIEPHTGRKIPLGTLSVRSYIRSWHKPQVSTGIPYYSDDFVDTSGPNGRYRFALFIEKEGFNALLDKAEIAERWDVAIFSTKGMSVTAARSLVDRWSDEGLTILVAHDFDKSGFDILTKLFTDTRRYKFRNRPKVVDIGLRLDDIIDMELDPEPVTYDTDKDPRVILRQQGATDEELAMLVADGRPGYWRGQRVELNAMTSRQFIDWLERKLKQAGVEKVMPDEDTIKAAYHRARLIAEINRVIADIKVDEQDVPENIVNEIREKIEGTASSWEDALQELVEANDDDDEDE